MGDGTSLRPLGLRRFGRQDGWAFSHGALPPTWESPPTAHRMDRLRARRRGERRDRDGRDTGGERPRLAPDRRLSADPLKRDQDAMRSTSTDTVAVWLVPPPKMMPFIGVTSA